MGARSTVFNLLEDTVAVTRTYINPADGTGGHFLGLVAFAGGRGRCLFSPWIRADRMIFVLLTRGRHVCIAILRLNVRRVRSCALGCAAISCIY